MMVLKINIDAMVRDYAQYMCTVANMITQDTFNGIVFRLKSGDAVNDVTILDAEYVGGLITAGIQSGVHAILDSYGTGSKMDTSNDYLFEYIGSKFWNPLRGGQLDIVGRKEGQYTNILGESVYSTGRLAGRDMDYMAKEPSYAIQTAEKQAFESRIEKYLTSEGGKWFSQNGYKYFYNAFQ